MPVAEQLPTEQGFQIGPLRSKTYYTLPRNTPGMVTFSPQTVATGSLALLLAGLAALGLISVVLPSADLLLGLAVLIAGLGAIGLLFAYYYATVLVWDAGNRAGAVALLAGPVVLAQVLASISAGTLPLGEDFAYQLGYQFGVRSLIPPAIGAVVVLYVGSFVRRLLPPRVPASSDAGPAAPPSSLVLGVGALLLTGVLWVGALPPV